MKGRFLFGDSSDFLSGFYKDFNLKFSQSYAFRLFIELKNSNNDNSRKDFTSKEESFSLSNVCCKLYNVKAAIELSKSSTLIGVVEVFGFSHGIHKDRFQDAFSKCIRLQL